MMWPLSTNEVAVVGSMVGIRSLKDSYGKLSEVTRSISVRASYWSQLLRKVCSKAAFSADSRLLYEERLSWPALLVILNLSSNSSCPSYFIAFMYMHSLYFLCSGNSLNCKRVASLSIL